MDQILKLIRAILEALGLLPKAPVPPTPPGPTGPLPTGPTGPVPPGSGTSGATAGTPSRIAFPAGAIRSRLPWGTHPSGISWDTIARWEPLFTEATAKAGNRFGPLLLAAFAVVETGGQHYTTGQRTGIPDQVIKGHGDDRSRGILQIRCDLHAPQDMGRCLDPRGHIELGAQLLTRWINEEGSWEAALTNKWHPGTDPHSQTTQASYIRAVRELIAEVKASWGPTGTTGPSVGQPYSVAGLAPSILLPFPLKLAIIPQHQTNQRPGIAMDPDRYVQHDTGNRNRGANALMHKNYLHNGAEGQQLSYHFTVDDKEAWQMIPVDEVAWHGGDGNGPCNFRGLSCELCINADINEPQSRRNAEILAAELMNAMGINSLKKHQDCAGKFCPQDMLGDGYWPRFVQRVSELRRERG